MTAIEYYSQKYREELKARNKRDRGIQEWASKQENKSASKSSLMLASSVAALCLRGIDEGENDGQSKN